MFTQPCRDQLEHTRWTNVLGALAVAAACLFGLGALGTAMTGCAVAAGAAAGGAVGYVAGHEAGEDEARDEIRDGEPHNDDDD